MPLHLKLAAGGGGLAFLGIIFGLGIFPRILKSQVQKSMTLSSENDVREMWEKMPFFIDFQVYLFNFTNHEEVQKGATPIVTEIGPFFFEKWCKKVIEGESEDTDTITYRKHDTFLFRPDLSGPGLTGEEEIIMPNIFLITIVTLMQERPTRLYFIKKEILKRALDRIYDNPTTVFMKVKVMDILFRGVIINCNRISLSAIAVCRELKLAGEDSLIFDSHNQYRFSILGRHNDSASPILLTVERGIKNIKNVGKVVAINNKAVQDIWQGECNKLDGSDGTIFAPFIPETDPIVSYAEAICRPIRFHFVKKTQYQGLKTHRYVARIGDLPNDPQLKCLCDSPENCVNGLMETTKCTNAPLYVSMPHFYDADPKLLQNVIGLSPNPENHSIAIDFEPITGTPLNAKNRIMLSMKLIKWNSMDIFATLPDKIVPLFWIKEDIALKEDIIDVLNQSLFKPKKIVKVISWLLITLGLLGIAGGMVYHCAKYEPDKEKKVTTHTCSAQVGSLNLLDKDGPAKLVI